MLESTSAYIIDAGNTRVKIAHFNNDSIKSVASYETVNRDLLLNKLAEIKGEKSILSSVTDNELLNLIQKTLSPTITLSSQTPLPIDLSEYKSIETLGTDRIANAVAGYHYAKSKNCLIIDIGTCIKFDMVTSDGYYQGGSISPGLKMRFKALSEFTGRLPFIENWESSPLIGQNTAESISSGVINGINAEIKGFVEQYNQQFKNLTIFLTGGDHKIFDIALKNSIFVDEKLTLKGLYLILKHNAN